jgi:hypothetical protein
LSNLPLPLHSKQKSIPYLSGSKLLSMSVLKPPAFNGLTCKLHKKSFKRQLGMLENLYSGTFKRLLLWSPTYYQSHLREHRILPINMTNNPHCKGLKAYPAAFSLQR